MITKRKWAEQILEELKFLSNEASLKSSWINRTGRYSIGYSEEMCVLFDDLNFSDVFIKEAKSLNISSLVIDSLKKTAKALECFDGENMCEADILANDEWIKCMNYMAETANLLETEINNVPEIAITSQVLVK